MIYHYKLPSNKYLRIIYKHKKYISNDNSSCSKKEFSKQKLNQIKNQSVLDSLHALHFKFFVTENFTLNCWSCHVICWGSKRKTLLTSANIMLWSCRIKVWNCKVSPRYLFANINSPKFCRLLWSIDATTALDSFWKKGNFTSFFLRNIKQKSKKPKNI